MISNVIPIKKLVATLSLFLGILCHNDANALTWKTPPDVFSDSRSSLDFASDPLGNAFTVWGDNGTEQYYSARFSAVTGTYDAPTALYPGSEGIRVATDATQTALFAFTDFPNSLLETAYFNGTTYVTPTPSPLRTTAAGVVISPAVAMDGLGNGVVVWGEEGVTQDIFSSFFDPGTVSWGPITQLNTPGFASVAPEVAYSADGTAVAIWNDLDTLEVYASNYNGTSWTAIPIVISSPSSINIMVEMDASGNALALWSNSSGDTLFFSYYSGGTWSAEAPISLIDNSSYSFQMSPNGNAVVGFTRGGEAYYSYFTGGSWGVPVQYSINAAGQVSSIAVAIDTAGNALLTWTDTNTNSTWSRLLTAGVLQPTADLISSDDTLETIFAGLADNGRGFVSGEILISELRGVFATYTLFAPPGMVAEGTICNNKFATQTDRIHIITFTPSTDPTVLAYYIRRNGVLIAAIPASGPYIYYDHNRCKRDTDVYTITAVSLEGEGLPAVVVLS
jgi:hypothetical protein